MSLIPAGAAPIRETPSVRRPSPKDARLRWAVLAGRLVVFGACLGLLALIVDPGEVLQRIASVSAGAVLLAIALQGGIVFALAWRWWIAVKATGPAPSYAGALRLTFLSTVFNLVLPTAVAGDLGRIWLGRRDGVDLSKGMAAALFDRMIGVAALTLLVAASVFIVPSYYPDPARWLMAAVVVGLAGGLAIVRLSARRPGNLFFGNTLRGLGQILSAPRLTTLAFSVSLASHLGSAVIATVIAGGMNVDLPLATSVLLFPAVILATILPVSIGGWGVRELAAIPLLRNAGLDAETAAAVTIVFGLTQLLAAGLGTAILMLAAAREAPR